MRILLCSEGSQQAENAVNFGAAIAEACRAETTLLGILEKKHDAAKLLSSLKNSQVEAERRNLRCALVTREGDPIDEIIAATNESNYDLVVIGAVRKGFRGSYSMSSKAYRIIRRIQPPVLAVTGSASRITKILICTGGKNYIDKALRLTGEIAKGTGASVTLLHVLGEPPAIYSHLPKMVETTEHVLASSSELGTNLRRSSELLESIGVKMEFRLRRGGVLDQVIAEIEDGGYELVVTGSALSRTFRSYVLGDLTRELVNRVNCAVLVTRTNVPAGDSSFGFAKLFGGRRAAPPKDRKHGPLQER
jgi:nucleotide-binding universal stress UspA family protein